MFYQLTTKYVCGIDLHAKKLDACVMDREGTMLKKKTIDCQPESLLKFLTPWKKGITVGVESTYNWYWLIDTLKEYEIPCCLGHALYIKRKMSTKHKTDSVDSRGIADLLRTNQFPLAYAYPQEMRTVRDLLRRRHFFVRTRASTFTHFQNSLHQDGCIEPLRNKLQYKSTRWSLVNLTDNIDLQKILSTDLEYIKSLDIIVDDLDKVIRDKARSHNRKHFEALQTMPGCGSTTALTILYETHTIDRFHTPQCFSSYSRVVRAENESAGKNLGGTSNDKIGNPYLKWAFSEIGQSMIKYYPDIQKWHQKQSVEHGKAGAHARLRHKIAVAVYYMLKNDSVFDMDNFLGKTKDRAENHSQKWTETSGQKKSEPISFKTDNPSGHSKIQKTKPRVKKAIYKNISGRVSLRTTGRRKVLKKA
jgi:transposase